jgi:hypothetical protein
VSNTTLIEVYGSAKPFLAARLALGGGGEGADGYGVSQGVAHLLHGIRHKVIVHRWDHVKCGHTITETTQITSIVVLAQEQYCNTLLQEKKVKERTKNGQM